MVLHFQVEKLVLEVACRDQLRKLRSYIEVFFASFALQRLLQRLLRDVEARKDAGNALESDRLRVQARGAGLQGDLASARAEASRAQEALRIQLGRNAGDVALAFDVETNPAPLHPFGRLWAEAEQHREELVVLAEQMEAAGARREQSSYARLPQLLVQGKLRTARPNPRVIPPVDEFRGDWSAGVSLAWSPTAFWAQTHRVSAAEEEQRSLAAELELVRRGLREQLAGVYAAVEASQARLRASDEAQQAAREALRVRRLRYRSGLNTLNDVIEAQTELDRAELNWLDALVALQLNRHVLARAAGIEIEDLGDQS